MDDNKIEILDINQISLVEKTKDTNATVIYNSFQDIENKAINISKSEDILLTLIAKIIVEIVINEEI